MCAHLGLGLHRVATDNHCAGYTGRVHGQEASQRLRWLTERRRPLFSEFLVFKSIKKKLGEHPNLGSLVAPALVREIDRQGR